MVANGISEATPFRSVLINIYDEEHDVLNRALSVGIPEDLWEQLSARPQPWQEYLSLLSPAFKVGDIAYFIPGDEAAGNVPEKLHVVNILPPSGTKGLESWHPDDLLIMPLYDVNSRIMGTISVDNPADGRRPDQVTVEMLELFALQACILIENYRQVQTLDDSLQTTEKTEKELAFSREQLPALLHKDLQQTLTVHGLHRQVERMRSGIEMAALTGQQTDVHTLLRTMAQEIIDAF